MLAHGWIRYPFVSYDVDGKWSQEYLVLPTLFYVIGYGTPSANPSESREFMGGFGK